MAKIQYEQPIMCAFCQYAKKFGNKIVCPATKGKELREMYNLCDKTLKSIVYGILNNDE